MPTNPNPTRTRRALLASALGAGAATVAGSLARPLPASAATGDFLTLGAPNSSALPTTLSLTAGTEPAFTVEGQAGGAVYGVSTGTTQAAIIGHSEGADGVSGSSTSAYGVSGVSTSSIGVAGFSTTGDGVYGHSDGLNGVWGHSGNGYGVYASVADRHFGVALRVDGRVILNGASGRATIAKGKRSVTVSPGWFVGSAAIVATLMGSAGGTTAVQRVAVNAGNVSFTIYLTAPAKAKVAVAWHVFG